MADLFYKFRIGDRVRLNPEGEDMYPDYYRGRFYVVMKRHKNGTFDAYEEERGYERHNLHCEYFDTEEEIATPEEDLFGALFGI